MEDTKCILRKGKKKNGVSVQECGGREENEENEKRRRKKEGRNIVLRIIEFCSSRCILMISLYFLKFFQLFLLKCPLAILLKSILSFLCATDSVTGIISGSVLSMNIRILGQTL